MQWTAVIPLKAEPLRKSRLAPAVNEAGRVALAAALYRHVTDCVFRAGVFEDVAVLSPSLPQSDRPVRWHPDEGLELNAALTRLREGVSGGVMVVHADLPLLEAADLKALAAAAEAAGCAIAPDRHQAGTNAIALLPGVSFTFAFGPGSLRAHLGSAPTGAELVERTGLAHDLDTMADVEALRQMPGRVPPNVQRCLQALEHSGH